MFPEELLSKFVVENRLYFDMFVVENHPIKCKKLATIVLGRKNVARPIVR